MFIARGSLDNAERFLTEAKKHAKQIDFGYVRPYLKKRLTSVEDITLTGDLSEIAEQALTTGVILQNAVLSAKR